ncbi:uncharacterized protein LOC108102466 [Drosophila eugracilis]|uniref:uncharacterized protein LOC108102466 n=1 Tax=Drosophila eugracilis TaxID=29029 RepID=UPI0007E6C9AC|nr:uncharacterized protein LOC108102466 [Drosophila eugracilis]
MWTALEASVFLVLANAPSSLARPENDFSDHLATYLRPGEPHFQNGETLFNMLYIHNKVQVFCQRPTMPTLLNVFQSRRLSLQIATDKDYSQYKGSTVREVFQAHQQLNECYEGKPLGSQAEETRIIPMAAHIHACYGIYTISSFTITLEVICCDPERVAQFTFGLVLWLSCPHLADSLLGFYCSAAALGAHLAGVAVVGVALLATSGGQPLRIVTLKGNFKQVLQERPTVMTLALLGGAWLLQSTCQRYSFLWRRYFIRRVHHRLLRIISYWLIFTASEYKSFGWSCLFLLITWPELWCLMRWLSSQYQTYKLRFMAPQTQAGFETQRVLRAFRLISQKYLPMRAPIVTMRAHNADSHDLLSSERNVSMYIRQEGRERRGENDGNAFDYEYRRPWNCLNRRLRRPHNN